MSKVTIITATTGSQLLKQNLQSVINQTYKNVQHLIVVDGQHHKENALKYLVKQDVIVLPYATGIQQYNGHRIYGGCTYFAEGDYIMFLDEDNWLEPNHVESLIEISDKNSFSCSLRKIVSQEGSYICNDDCENLGNWQSVLGDYFVDVNCFFLPKLLALQLSPLWYKRARHSDDQPEVDRALTSALKDNNIRCNVSGKYTVNYRVGNRNDSVQGTFFLRGNELMKQKYDGVYPWRK